MNVYYYGCIGLALLAVFVSGISQVMLKFAAQKSYNNIIKEYLNPLVIGAYSLFFITTIMSIVAYKIIPLSMGPILEATGYLYAIIFGKLIFHEKIGKKRVFAMIIILVGIVIFSV